MQKFRINFRALITSSLLAVLLPGLLSSCSDGSGSVIKDVAVIKVPEKNIEELKDFEVPLIEGSTKKLSAIQASGKVMVYDFWATWCGPCRMEIPYLIEIQKEYGDKGVEVIGLSLENPKTDADKVRAFARELSINYQLGFASDEMFSAFTGGAASIPQTLIFDRNGKLVRHIRGLPRNPELIRPMLRDAVDKALQQS